MHEININKTILNFFVLFVWHSSYVLTVSIKTVEHLCSHVVSVMSASKKSDNSEVQIQNLKNLIPTEAKLQFYRT